MSYAHPNGSLKTSFCKTLLKVMVSVPTSILPFVQSDFPSNATGSCGVRDCKIKQAVKSLFQFKEIWLFEEQSGTNNRKPLKLSIFTGHKAAPVLLPLSMTRKRVIELLKMSRDVGPWRLARFNCGKFLLFSVSITRHLSCCS